MLRVSHFEITADDVERAIKFYTSVFGWEIKKWDGPVDYWMVMTDPKDQPGQPGIDGGLMKRQHEEGQPGGYYNTIDVPSVDEYVAKVTEHGGEVLVPKMTIPTVGYMAYFRDTEGNIFSVMEMDESAA
jgi:hypothetical protein